MKGDDAPPPDKARYIPPAWAEGTDPNPKAAGHARKMQCLCIGCMVVVAAICAIIIALLLMQMEEETHMESGCIIKLYWSTEPQ